MSTDTEDNNNSNSLEHLSFSRWLEPLEPAFQTQPIYTRITVRSFTEEINVPRVAFGSPTAFDMCIEKFLRQMSRSLRNMIWSWLSVDPGAQRLTWTRRDMLLNGMADFPEIFANGRELLLKVTENRGLSWCDCAMAHMSEIILAAYRAYVRSCVGWKPELDQNIFILGLQNELVTTMYETAHILNPLFHHNFIAIYYDDNHLNMRKFILVAREIWEEILVAFMSGLHPRLGKCSPVNELNEDITLFLRKYLMH